MKPLIALRSAIALLMAASLAACIQAPTRTVPRPRMPPVAKPQVAPRPPMPPRPRVAPKPPVAPADADGPPLATNPPRNYQDIPEPIPRDEPKSPYGNPPTYEVFGKTYTTMESAKGYRETGLASWYGRKFHGKKTSSGEPYDMFKLTAAHKSLPLPCYIRVTNINTGKSTIVKVNDRGPFHDSRIIDLSYATAAKLGMLGEPAMVEVEAIVPGEILPPAPGILAVEPASPSQPNFLQVAAYSDPINAVALKEEIRALGISNIQIRDSTYNDDPVQRVLVGPFKEAKALTAARKRLLGAGLAPVTVSR